MTSAVDNDQFTKHITRPDLDCIASLKAAVEFCADRYDSVNHNYVSADLEPDLHARKSTSNVSAFFLDSSNSPAQD
jgi:hypothetical protein